MVTRDEIDLSFVRMFMTWLLSEGEGPWKLEIHLSVLCHSHTLGSIVIDFNFFQGSRLIFY